MVNFGILTAEIRWRVWGTPSKFQRVSRLDSVIARHYSSGRQPDFAPLNRGRHLCWARRPSRWALAHILVKNFVGHIMAALRIADANIIFLPCDFYLLFYSSLNLSGSQTGCLPYFHTYGVAFANLECRSEMCCTRLAGNTGRKKSPSAHHRTTCRAISSQLRHVSTIGKNLLNSNISPHTFTIWWTSAH